MLKRLASALAICVALLASVAGAQTPVCQTVWAQNVVSSSVGSNAAGGSSGASSALGDVVDNYFGLGNGGNIVVDFGQPFSNSGDATADICVDEWGQADCYYVCFDPADAFTQAALIAAGMTGGPTWYEFSNTWCGDANIDLDALVPGYAAGQLKFDKVMILDDSNGGDGAEVDRVCANVCTYPQTPGTCTTVWASVVVGSQQGSNANSSAANPGDALGDTVGTYFNLGSGGYITLAFSDAFTNSGDAQADLCIREKGDNDCYYLCFTPADAATTNAIIAAGWHDNGNGTFEPYVTWCGNEDIDLDSMLPGHAEGSLRFSNVMILDDSSGGNGAEVEGVCALICTPMTPMTCVIEWASSVVGSNQGGNADAAKADANATLGDTPATRFSLGNGGYVTVAFSGVFTNSGDSADDLCIDEWNDNDCYYLCFTPADAGTTAAVIAAGWHDNGNGTFEPYVTWCGDENIDLDAMLPGHAQGSLHFSDVMILDDSNGSDGAEIERVCALVCVPVLGKIGDFVWRDADCDGIQDQGEPGLEGLTLELLDQATLTVITTTTTDANGAWCFTDLPAGDYVVHLNYNQVSYALATPMLGGDVTLDSDFDVQGAFALVSLAAGEQRTDIDAGLCVICPGPPATQISYPCGYDPINDPIITVSDLVPGEPVTLSMQTQFPGSTGFIFYSVGPVTPVAAFGCVFYVDVLNQSNIVLAADFFLDQNGYWESTTTDTLPLAYLGIEVIFQGRVCAQGGIPGPFDPLPDFFSNAVVATIGCP